MQRWERVERLETTRLFDTWNEIPYSNHLNEAPQLNGLNDLNAG